MKVIKFLVVVTVFGVMLSCNNTQKSNKDLLKNEIDSVSYAIGLSMASQVNQGFTEINRDIYMIAFKEGLDTTNTPLINKRFASAIIQSYFSKKKKKEVNKTNLSKFGNVKIAGEKFLAENKSKEGIKTTATGLQYQIIKEGKGETPKATDKVKLHYHGTTIDGTVFDSSVERKKPYELGVNQFVKGFAEGLQLMKPGAKYKFFIPQELAYGAQDRGALIKPFSALIFEVELLEIKK